jgi:hypothetical protein
VKLVVQGAVMALAWILYRTKFEEVTLKTAPNILKLESTVPDLSAEVTVDIKNKED